MLCALGSGVEIVGVVVIVVAAALERGVQGVLELALVGGRKGSEGSERRVTGGRGGEMPVVGSSVSEEGVVESLENGVSRCQTTDKHSPHRLVVREASCTPSSHCSPALAQPPPTQTKHTYARPSGSHSLQPKLYPTKYKLAD